jgi:AbrB family looped-hinge helix DNA binding protein
MQKVLGTSKLSQKFQVTISKDARKLLDLKAGDRIIFLEEDSVLIIKKG